MKQKSLRCRVRGDIEHRDDTGHEADTEYAVMERKRIIFHVDVNSAFLSWSAVKRLREDPFCVDLRTVPAAVGGDVETRHGIITAKSIPAKRYGITTGEPVVKALQKCPGLILVSSDWETYRTYSRAFIGILHEFSEIVQQASVDEAYVDVTQALSGGRRSLRQKLTEEKDPAASGLDEGDLCEEALQMAAAIRDSIRTRLGFTVNVGISTNKLLAKMASDFQKPDKTHTLWPEEIPDKMWPLPIASLYGCGAKTAARLAGLGVVTIGDAAALELSTLQDFLGEKGGEYIHRASHGQGSDHVRVQSEEAKSYSNEVTTAEDVTLQSYERMVPPILQSLSEKVAGRLQKDGLFGSTVTVSVKTDDFHRHSRQLKLTSSTNEAAVICGKSGELLKALLYERGGIFDRGAGVRLIGVGVSTLDRGEYRQLDLEGFLKEQKRKQEEKKRQEAEQERLLRETQRRSRLDEMMKKIKSRYGEDTIHRGVD